MSDAHATHTARLAREAPEAREARAILSVAYPLARVSPDAVGGAEQVLATLDAALVAAGRRSIVIAPEGSRVTGELRAFPIPAPPFDDRARAEAQREVRARLAATLAEAEVDVVHLHGLDFHAYLPAPAVPTLVTLHLPLELYPRAVLSRVRTFEACFVSRDQRARAPWLNERSVTAEAVIPNGVDLDALLPRGRKRAFALALARVCPEKGLHLALDAAAAAEVPLAIGGEVHPYAEHQAYFARVVAPRLGPRARFLGPLGRARKRRLLAAARCRVIASTVAETSSLVAMEALACGTPVVALASGALPEIVDHGVTGFLAHDVRGLAEGIRHAHALDPRTCRAAAEARFDATTMIGRYFARYDALAHDAARARGA